ncbi:MAG: hypothetical protein K0R82_2866 [Flavipsychrobacter sp.]|jgi:hypothetical protein|nr:hypothetical protein [Flavipsychrobacter sp.]
MSVDKAAASKQYVRDLANSLSKHGSKRTVDQLAGYLNRRGLFSTHGKPYNGLRGTYTLVRATYQWLKKQGLSTEAERVANSFIKPDGTIVLRSN